MVGHKNEHARRYLRYVFAHSKGSTSVWGHITSSLYLGSLIYIGYCVCLAVKPPHWRGRMVLHGLPMAIHLQWRVSMTKPWLPTSLLPSWWKGGYMSCCHGISFISGCHFSCTRLRVHVKNLSCQPTSQTGASIEESISSIENVFLCWRAGTDYYYYL